MDLLDEPTEGVAGSSSARASWPPLAKLSEVGYCRLGVLLATTVESMKDERLDTRLCQRSQYLITVTLLTKLGALLSRV